MALGIEQRHAQAPHVRAADVAWQCWTRDELRAALRQAGFGSVDSFGAYQAIVTRE